MDETEQECSGMPWTSQCCGLRTGWRESVSAMCGAVLLPLCALREADPPG